MLGEYCIHNGKFIRAEEAKISIGNIEFSYGFGVYENLKVRGGKIYFADEHVERLFNSAQVIGLQHNFKEEIIKWLVSLVVKNKVEAANIKILLIGGEKPDLYILTLSPKFLDKKYYRHGVKVITYQYERFLPQAKTLNMLPSYLIYKKAVESGAHDALLVDKQGYITEGTRSNFFVLKKKTIYTAPAEKVLAGVTRKTVIDCVRQNGYEVVEKNIKLSEVLKYSGAFLTHTSGKIVPIRNIDGREFPEIDEDLRELMRLYDAYLDAIVKT